MFYQLSPLKLYLSQFICKATRTIVRPSVPDTVSIIDFRNKSLRYRRGWARTRHLYRFAGRCTAALRPACIDHMAGFTRCAIFTRTIRHIQHNIGLNMNATQLIVPTFRASLAWALFWSPGSRASTTAFRPSSPPCRILRTADSRRISCRAGSRPDLAMCTSVVERETRFLYNCAWISCRGWYVNGICKLYSFRSLGLFPKEKRKCE